MLKNRSLFSLAAHALATIVATYIAVVIMAKSADLFNAGNDVVEAGAGIFSMFLWFIALFLFVIALLPFIAVLIGWLSFFARLPWLTLIASICYGLVSLLSTNDANNLYFLPSAALGFVGWLQESKTKRSAKPNAK